MILKKLLIILIIIIGFTKVEGSTDYDDYFFLREVDKLIVYGTNKAIQYCALYKMMPLIELFTGIDLSQFNCAARSGIVRVDIAGNPRVLFYVEVANGYPLAGIFENQYGIRHTVKVGGILISEFGGNRFVYDYTTKRFLEANFPILTMTAKQIIVGQKGIEITTNELIDALSDYYNFSVIVNQQLGEKISVDQLINALLTNNEERKLFLRFVVMRRFYDFSKVHSQYATWIFGFTLSPFCQINKCLDTTLVINTFVDNMPVSIARDLTKKMESISVGKARVVYRLDEQGVKIIEVNFMPVTQLMDEIKKFDVTYNFSDQMLKLMKQYAARR